MLRCIRLALLLAVLGSAASCGASRAAPAVDPRGQARKLYEEGRSRAEAGQWAEAKARHSEAFRLFPHWQIAGALGLAELHLKEHRDAAEHLTFFLAEAPTEEVSAAERKEMSAHLATATARVGSVALHVEDGADVQIDGEPVGVAPLKNPLFVAPGKHTIEATRAGRRGSSSLVIRAGTKVTVKLKLADAPGASQPAK